MERCCSPFESLSCLRNVYIRSFVLSGLVLPCRVAWRRVVSSCLVLSCFVLSCRLGLLSSWSLGLFVLSCLVLLHSFPLLSSLVVPSRLVFSLLLPYHVAALYVVLRNAYIRTGLVLNLSLRCLGLVYIPDCSEWALL